MLRIAILDDKRVFLDKLHQVIRSILTEEIVRIDLFQSERSLDQARDQFEYDLYLLDIEIDKENGIEIAKKIRETSHQASIVFVTSHHEYAVEAYDAYPLSFLVKPPDRDKLASILRMIAERKNAPQNFLEITENYRKIRVPVDDIVAIQKEGRKTLIQLYSKDTVETLETMKRLYQKLSKEKGFIYIRKDTIIRIDHILRLEESKEDGVQKNVVMKNSSVYSASREGFRHLLEILINR